MSDEAPPLIRTSTSDAAARSLVEDVRQLAADGRTLLEAELTYQKSRAAVAGLGAKGAALWGALALALGFFAVMALVFGLVLVVATYAGPILATVVVTLVLIVAAGLSGLIARNRWRRAARLLAEPEPAGDD